MAPYLLYRSTSLPTNLWAGSMRGGSWRTWLLHVVLMWGQGWGSDTWAGVLSYPDRWGVLWSEYLSLLIHIHAQGLLFLTEDTLRGSKQSVYVIMKIIKLCTDSTASSYQIKFAVDERLMNMDPDKIGMGVAIRRVMEYVSIKKKFVSVHPALAMLGVTGVEVMEHGLCFLRGQTG